MRIIALRHGQTQWNVERRLQGHTDIPLNLEGLAQAAAVAEQLQTAPITAAYSSDLARAMLTAEKIAFFHQKKVIPLAVLRERQFGLFEGLTRPEMALQHPDAFETWQSSREEASPPGGESLQDVRHRIRLALVELSRVHCAHETIVIVGHGGGVDALHWLATGQSYRHIDNTIFIPNAMPIYFRWEDDSLSIEPWLAKTSST